MNMDNVVLIKAVTISAKTRHKNDRREITILVPTMKVALRYYWTGAHRDFVKGELYKLGLKSCTYFLSLTCSDGTVLNKDELEPKERVFQ